MFRRMDSRNKASDLNSRRKRNRRIIDAVVTDHFKVLIRDMDNEPFNKFNGRNSFNNEFVIFMSVVMEGNMGAGIRIDTGSGNDRSAEIATNVFRDDRRVAVVGFSVDIEAFRMIPINGRFDFLEGRTEFVMETIKQSSTEGTT